MSDVSFGTQVGNSITPPTSKVPSQNVPSHGRQSDFATGPTGSMESCQLRRAAVSLGRGASQREVRYSLTNVTRSCGEAASCPVDLKLFA